jgi:MFS family permease
MSKAIPIERRGRLFGSAQFTGGVLSIGAGMLITALLSNNGPGFPHDYAAILALSGVCLLFSLFSLSLVMEPDEPVQDQRPAWRDYLPQLLHTLRQDRAFARLILVQLLAGFDGLAIGFYILFATQELGLPPGYVGAFTTVLTVGKIVASVGLGALAERAGSHRVIQVSIAFSLSAPLVGLALLLTDAQPNAMTAAIYGWVFVAIGVMISSRMLGYYSYALALAPAGQRPTYIGLFNTIGGALVVLPTLGGWLLRVSSYGVLFAITATVLSIACVLGLSLPSARRAEQLEKQGKTS